MSITLTIPKKYKSRKVALFSACDERESEYFSLFFTHNSRHGGDWVVRRTHLSENLVKPKKRSVQVDFDPTRRAGDVLAMVLSAPAFHKRHAGRSKQDSVNLTVEYFFPVIDDSPNGAHLSQLIDGFKSLPYVLRKQLSELLVVENLQRARRWNFADSSRVESVMIVAVARLNEDSTVGQALSVDFTADVVKVDSFADVTASIFDRGIPVDVGKKAQAKSIGVGRRVREAIDDDGRRSALEYFSDAGVQLVVSNCCPARWFLAASIR